MVTMPDCEPEQVAESKFVVTEKAMRPADPSEQCFYCKQPIGGFHLLDCVLIKKRVKVRAVVEYWVCEPAFWDKGMVEFHRNDSCWCADNMLDELDKVIEEKGCLCDNVVFECLDDSGEPFLCEG